MSVPVVPGPIVDGSARRPWVCHAITTLGLVMVFAAGAISGAAGYSYYMRSHLIYLREHPQEIPDMVMGKLTYELGLSEKQLPVVGQIVRRNHAELDRTWQEVRPKIDDVCVVFEQEMKEALTPSQYEIWLPKFRDVRRVFFP